MNIDTNELIKSACDVGIGMLIENLNGVKEKVGDGEMKLSEFIEMVKSIRETNKNL